MSDYKPFSIIIADSMEAVEEIHAARQLPPLVSWAEESVRLEAEGQGNNQLATAVAGAHLKNGYLMKVRDTTLYAVIDEAILRQQDALQAAGFPIKAGFLALEVWVSIDGEAVNLRDRTGPTSGKYDITAIPEPFDLITRPVDTNGLLIELHSRNKGYIGTLIDTTVEQMRMSLISVIDHMTGDMSDPAEYSVVSLQTATGTEGPHLLPKETWVMLRTMSADMIFTLGCFTEKAGAERALKYLQEYPRG